MLVLDAPMDLDLAHQLLLGPTLGQRRLLDDLRRVDVVCLGVDELPALGEPALAKELPFDVFSDRERVAVLVLLFHKSLLAKL